MQLKNECMCRTAAIWTLFIFFPGKSTLKKSEGDDWKAVQKE